jgi:polar amino acid transport system substrate-binding protein
MKRALITIFIFIFIFTGTAFCYSADLQAKDLIYQCEDIPPSNYLESGELKGVSIELLKLLWKKMGVPEQSIQVVPWARGYNALQNEKGHVLFSMSRTKERENLFKWVGPIFSVKHVLLGISGKKIVLNKLDDAKNYRIGVIKEDESEFFLMQSGFNPAMMESVSSLEQNFEKLKMGRVDFIAHSLETFNDYIKIHQLNPDQYHAYFVLSEKQNYYAFHKDTPDALILQFQNALNSIRLEHMAILKKYGISL